MNSQSLIELAGSLAEWSPRCVHAIGDGHALQLINAGVKRFEFDVHACPETLIALKGAYAIETPDGEVAIPAGSAFTVPPGLPHRPANRERCVLLVLS